LGTDFGKSPSDSTFRLLLAQLDVEGFETLLSDVNQVDGLRQSG
jgi:hypothetical protein